MESNERYNTLRRALNFNKFIKWLKDNPDVEYKNLNSRSCPVALYLQDTLSQDEFIDIRVTYFDMFYDHIFYVYKKSLPHKFIMFVQRVDQMVGLGGKIGDTIKMAELIKEQYKNV